MDEDTINKLPDTVKVISNFAVGFGNIDLEAAKKRGIAVTNTPEVLSDATAENWYSSYFGCVQKSC
jgi:glyoxylate reductase